MGQKYAFIRPDAALYGTEFKFGRHGSSGAELSEVLPHLAEVVDDIAIVKSMYHGCFQSRPQGQVLMQNRFHSVWAPLLWFMGPSTGLAAKAENLPGFVVLKLCGRLEWRHIPLRQWLFAHSLSRRSLPQNWRPCFVSLQPCGCD